MSTLPDLNTDDVSFIAYWNAITQGGVSESNFNAEDVLSLGAIRDQTLYDNGIICEVNLDSSGAVGTLRVKNDGWFVCYLDRQADWGQSVTDPGNVQGPWAVVSDWTGSSPNGIEPDSLARLIGNAQGHLDASVNYASADVGLFNYEFSQAEHLTYLMDSSGGQWDNGGSSQFLYTDTTNLVWAACTAHTTDEHDSTVIFEPASHNVTVSSGTHSDVTNGAVNLLDHGGQNLIPDPNVEYTVERVHDDEFPRSHGTIVALWY